MIDPVTRYLAEESSILKYDILCTMTKINDPRSVINMPYRKVSLSLNLLARKDHGNYISNISVRVDAVFGR